MFGVNLKYGFHFLSAMIGSSIASVVLIVNKFMANSIGFGGLPGILSIKPEFMFIFFIAMIIAIVVPFILTIILSKSRNTQFKIFK